MYIAIICVLLFVYLLFCACVLYVLTILFCIYHYHIKRKLDKIGNSDFFNNFIYFEYIYHI